MPDTRNLSRRTHNITAVKLNGLFKWAARLPGRLLLEASPQGRVISVLIGLVADLEVWVSPAFSAVSEAPPLWNVKCYCKRTDLPSGSIRLYQFASSFAVSLDALSRYLEAQWIMWT